jgi:transglutaminase-like putative cysteine protease
MDAGPHTMARDAGQAVYAIEHDTRYAYDAAVSTSQHLACLRPRDLPYQQVHSFELLVDPPPAQVAERLDYFGNSVHQFQLLRPHVELRVIARSHVEVHARSGVVPEESPPWEDVRSALAHPGGEAAGTVAAFSYASPHIVRSPELARFARPSFTPGRPLLVAALDLMRRIHAEFVFDASATTGGNAGDTCARRPARCVSGLRALSDRLSEVARTRGAIRQRVSSDRPASGTAPPRRRRFIACVALGPLSKAWVG